MRGAGAGAAAGCVALAALLAPGAVAGVPPEEAYRLHCSGCHGPEGAGSEGVAPPLRGVHRLLGWPGGRAYLVRVPGVAQAPLGSEELAQLMNWVLREISGAGDFVPYGAGEVEAWRREPLRDPLSARPAPGR